MKGTRPMNAPHWLPIVGYGLVLLGYSVVFVEALLR
jgi:hypothetical protein